jgi:hypothetical protein
MLKNRIVVEIHTASFRTTRGYSIVPALLDELAYWPTDESAAAQAFRQGRRSSSGLAGSDA